MKLRNSLFVSMLFVTASMCSASEPELKPAVRLALDASRLQGWVAPEVVDWNNDGLNDLVVGHFSGAVFVYLNRGFGKNGLVFEKVDIRRQDNLASGGKQIWAWRFNKANCVCPGPGRVSPRVLDWDNNGKKDLILGDGRGAQTRVWRNIGTDKEPLFSTHHLQYLPPDAGVRPYHETVQPFIVDWNRDGKKDLLMGRNRGAYIYINEGEDASPNFDFDCARLGSKIRDLFPVERLSPVVVDWDGDGKNDLLVGTPRGEVWFARNVGSPVQPKFDGYIPVRAGNKEINIGSEARIAIADLDGDGRRDLLVGGDNGVVRFFQATHPDPIARSRYARVNRDGAVRVDLIGTDDAGRTLEYNTVTQPKFGSLFETESSLTYKPRKGFTGRDQFTFVVATGELHSPPATVTIDVQPPETSPTITVHPQGKFIGVGQPTSFRVAVSGRKPYSYQWIKNGTAIPNATGPGYFIREARESDSGAYSVAVKNSLGVVTSRSARFDVKPFPNAADNVPIIDIKVVSHLIEPATAGVLKLTRSGNTTRAVTVRLASRRAHDPVVADIHYVPIPKSVTFEAGQMTREIEVQPIDDTLVNGQRMLTFLIVPNPAYRLASKSAAVQMKFHDDDCPQVSISAVEVDTQNANGERSFKVTAFPPPKRDTEIAYSIGGTAVAGIDYEMVPGTVAIAAGQSSALITITPFRQSKDSTAKTVVATLQQRRFTFFDFYGYLTEGGTRTASVQISGSSASRLPPEKVTFANRPDVEKLRREVAKLGWIYFTGRSNDAKSDFDIFVMRPDGSELRNLTNTPQYDEHSPRVSPGGKRMLFRRLPKSGKTDRSI